MTATVLIVEDEILQARSIKRSLERHGYQVLMAATAEAGLALVQCHHPDILLLDVHLPGMDGLAMFRTVRERQNNLQVIMITANGNVQTAVEAMRLGAYDYITKPLDLAELRLVLERAHAHTRQEQELSYLRQQSRRTPQANLPLGQCARMREVATQLQKFATVERRRGDGVPPVLLLGETGTGKGFVARMLHTLSPRSLQPFVEVNCAALPATLLEAELFGYEQGSSPTLTLPSAGYSRPLRAAPSFWMKSATLALMRRPDSCTCSKPVAFGAWVPWRCGVLMSALLRRRMSILRLLWPAAPFAPTSIIGCTC